MAVKVYDIFARLSVDLLSNLSMSEDGSGTIRESDHPKIVNGINSAMKRLYNRFVIREGHIRVLLNKDKVVYPLIIENTYSHQAANPGSTIEPFIWDIGDGLYTTFKGDMLQIIGVHDAHGRPVAFNDPVKARSVSFPAVNKLVLKPNMCGLFNDELRITYKPKYVPLPLGEDVTEQEIDIPEVLEDPLLYLIASMVYSGMNGQDNIAISLGHQNTFEALCTEITLTDTVNESTSSIGSKFDERGFT